MALDTQMATAQTANSSGSESALLAAHKTSMLKLAFTVYAAQDNSQCLPRFAPRSEVHA